MTKPTRIPHNLQIPSMAAKGLLLLALLVSFCGISPGQELNKRLSFGPSVELAQFEGFDNSPSSLGFGAGVRYALTEQWFLEATAVFGSLDQSFDTPGGTALLPVRTLWSELIVSRELFTLGSIADLYAVTGFGITQFTRESVSIPLGALGTADLPSLTESHWHYMLGVRVSRDLVSGISFSLGSNLRLLDPLSSPESSYTFSGGITVDIL